MKFNKYRSVDKLYLNVPLKYCFKVKGKNNKHSDKDFVIVDSFGKNFLCGWRNNKTCKIGMTFLCKKAILKGKEGFYYKDKFYILDKYGWVF